MELAIGLEEVMPMKTLCCTVSSAGRLVSPVTHDRGRARTVLLTGIDHHTS